jgi:plastocyanin
MKCKGKVDLFLKLLIILMSMFLLTTMITTPPLLADPPDDDDDDHGDNDGDDSDDDGDGGGSDDGGNDGPFNQIPIAVIETITPNPADEYDPITFTGYGVDNQFEITEYWWEIDSEVTNENQSFTKTLNPGEHTIEFWVKNEQDTWSDSDQMIITVTNNTAPNTPSIEGPTQAQKGEPIEYTFTSTDDQGDQITYHIDWDDGNTQESTITTISHTYTKKGTYTLRCKAIDEHGEESQWGTMEISMPKTKLTWFEQSWLREFITHFPILNQILNQWR